MKNLPEKEDKIQRCHCHSPGKNQVKKRTGRKRGKAQGTRIKGETTREGIQAENIA